MRTIRYFLGRLSAAVPTLFAIVTVGFFLVRLAPGGPFDAEQALPADVAANLRAAYGLDQPIYVQYGRYLAALTRGDFGPSFRYRDLTVTELIRRGLPVTLCLGAAALLVALAGGITLGSLAALRHERLADHLAMGFAATALAVPSFVLLPLLDLLFGVHLGWLPVAGWDARVLAYWPLPVLALALPPLVFVARLTRAGLLDVLQSAYVRTARAKGLPLAIVVLRHAMRPALIPVAGYLPPAVAAIMTGSLVVETIAGLPGIGRFLVQGALNRDYTLVLGMIVVYSGLLIAMGLLVDLLYVWLDPRVRLHR
jgi:oligopeptide transport system permease protein